MVTCKVGCLLRQSVGVQDLRSSGQSLESWFPPLASPSVVPPVPLGGAASIASFGLVGGEFL